MYGFQDYSNLSPEEAVKRVSQEKVFEEVFGQQIFLGRMYTSVFRLDRKPGCFFEYRDDGTLIFVDFAEIKGRTHRSCIGAIIEKYNFSLQSAIEYICKNYELPGNESIVTVPYSKIKESGGRSEVQILYTSKPYTRQDVVYWSKFLIRPQELLSDNVYAVENFQIIRDKRITRVTPFGCCYAIDFIDTVKLYQPYREKDRHRWITNCDENDIGNIDNLPASGRKLIIQKSYKDYRVLKNTIKGLNIIWFQNEGCVPSLDILKNLTERFEMIIIFFDNDESGVRASIKLQLILEELQPGCSMIVNLPIAKRQEQLYGHYLKDPSEFISREGKQDLIKVLKQIGIW